jgi:hypothetical protein
MHYAYVEHPETPGHLLGVSSGAGSGKRRNEVTLTEAGHGKVAYA